LGSGAIGRRKVTASGALQLSVWRRLLAEGGGGAPEHSLLRERLLSRSGLLLLKQCRQLGRKLSRCLSVLGCSIGLGLERRYQIGEILSLE
jgi:hypothetical protein